MMHGTINISGFPHFTLKFVTVDFFYKLSNTSAANKIRENEKVPANNPLTIVHSVSPILSVIRLVVQNEKSTNSDSAFSTVTEGSFM
jgi:heme/copper-type cytochrome/quinol oxidase subunit 2